jgi:hypothetical protein
VHGIVWRFKNPMVAFAEAAIGGRNLREKPGFAAWSLFGTTIAYVDTRAEPEGG